MIRMANADPDERQQIEKNLEYGDAKLKQLQDRKKELELLEQDILATRQKLIHRINNLKKQTKTTQTKRGKNDDRKTC
jgi:hypothetical protein